VERETDPRCVDEKRSVTRCGVRAGVCVAGGGGANRVINRSRVTRL
jgi:hypothetical protein